MPIWLTPEHEVKAAERAARHASEDTAKQAAETEAVTETAAYGLLVLLIALLIVLLITPGCGGGSPTSPTIPPQQSTCTILHHDEEIRSDLQVVNGRLVLVVTTIPAYDETVCK